MNIFRYIFKICEEDGSGNQYCDWVQCGRCDRSFHCLCANIYVDEGEGKNFYCWIGIYIYMLCLFIYCYLYYILIYNYILYIISLFINVYIYIYIDINRFIDIDKAVFLKVYFTNLYPQLWILFWKCFRLPKQLWNKHAF